MTTEKFIQKAKEIYGDKFDYSKVEYKDSRTKVTIICPRCGEFTQIPRTHLKGEGCPICNKSEKNLKDFIKKSKRVHGDKYDYSKSVYKGANEKIEVICPIHGSFWIRASAHYSQNQGCSKCGIESNIAKQTLSFGEVIDKCIDIYDNKYKYIYSKGSYINTKSELEIICPEHGIFKISAYRHLHGAGCPQCQESFGETKVRTILEQSNCKYVYQAHFNFLDRLSYDFFLPDLNIAIEY